MEPSSIAAVIIALFTGLGVFIVKLINQYIRLKESDRQSDQQQFINQQLMIDTLNNKIGNVEKKMEDAQTEHIKCQAEHLMAQKRIRSLEEDNSFFKERVNFLEGKLK